MVEDTQIQVPQHLLKRILNQEDKDLDDEAVEFYNKIRGILEPAGHKMTIIGGAGVPNQTFVLGGFEAYDPEK